MSEPQSEYLTVSQAAARLGVSERTLLKRIKSGEVQAEKRPLDGGGVAWRVQLSPDRAGSEMESAPEARRNPFERESASERKRAGSEMETAPEVSDTRAGTAPEAHLLDYLRTENEYLKSQVDAWRLQAEAANRTAAETSAALRKALDAMPKALASGSTADAAKTLRENAPQAAQSNQVSQTTPVPIIGAVGRSGARVLRPWQRVIMRVIGAR